MLQFLRRSKKQIPTSNATPDNATASSSKPKTTFFDLPAEIRNEIYLLLARQTTLTLFPDTARSTSKKTTRISSKKAGDLTPGLFLTSRRSRQESTAILLSAARIHANVVDFDFHSLTRVVGSLYATELKALRQNPRLFIVLRMKVCSRALYTNLWRWCVARADSLDRLEWRYVLHWEGEGSKRPWEFADWVKEVGDAIEGDAEKFEARRVEEVFTESCGPMWSVRNGCAERAAR